MGLSGSPKSALNTCLDVAWETRLPSEVNSIPSLHQQCVGMTRREASRGAVRPVVGGIGVPRCKGFRAKVGPPPVPDICLPKCQATAA